VIGGTSRRRRLALAAAVLGLAVLGVAGCGDDDGPGGPTVARVGSERISLDDLRRYLDANMLDDPDAPLEGADADRVRSRLFDALIEERLLADEARRRGIEVSEQEAEHSLHGDAPAPDDPLDDRPDVGFDVEEVPESTYVEIRRRLMVEKLQAEVLRELPPLTEDEVRAWVETHHDRLQPGEQLELRALAVPSVVEGKRIQREIARRRMTFNEAVVQHRQDPGQGTPFTVAVDTLSDTVREALETVKPGRTSDPLELNGEIYVFQLLARHPAANRSHEELMELARQEMQTNRRRQAYAELVGSLERTTRVRRYTRRLPFTYVADTPGQD